MWYRMRLQSVDGRHFYFEGFKEIHDDPGFDAWSDTTTLYITIWSGEHRVISTGPAPRSRSSRAISAHCAGVLPGAYTASGMPWRRERWWSIFA